MKTIIEEFLKFIQIEKGLSENTIGAYRRDLAKYEEYMKEHKIAHIDFCLLYTSDAADEVRRV